MGEIPGEDLDKLDKEFLRRTHDLTPDGAITVWERISSIAKVAKAISDLAYRLWERRGREISTKQQEISDTRRATMIEERGFYRSLRKGRTPPK